MPTVPSSAASRLVTLPDGIPDLTLGWEVLGWATKYLRHPNGIRAGERWQCTPGQARFILWWYAVDPDGSWLYYHAVRRLAKGSGKSPFAAVLALAEFCAPVRLKDFDSAAPGGCVGKPVDMPLVQIAAVAEAQTENTMRMVRAMARKGSRIVDDYRLDPGRTRYNMLPEGSLQVLTSSSATAEGAEATFIVADEVEHWLPAGGGPEFHATLLDNLTKSGNRMLETSNAWKPDVGSVAQESFETWVDQEDGVTRNDKKVLYDARIAPPDTDLADEDSLRAALEFVYADCPWANIDATITRIWSKNARPDDSKRKYLNRPTAPLDAWCDPVWWDAMAADGENRPRRPLVDGERVVLFFDGSKTRDDTALVGCCLSDGHIFTVGVWSPGNSHDGDEVVAVDVEAIDAAVQRAFDTYEVVGFFSDVREWESFAKVTWPQRWKDDLLLWANPGGKQPEPIAWDMRSHDYDFTMACELVEAEIREARFTHDGDPRLRRHVQNARRRDGRYGVGIRKESPNSANKIDGAVCVIGARMMYRLALDKEPKKQHTGEARFFSM